MGDYNIRGIFIMPMTMAMVCFSFLEISGISELNSVCFCMYAADYYSFPQHNTQRKQNRTHCHHHRVRFQSKKYQSNPVIASVSGKSLGICT